MTGLLLVRVDALLTGCAKPYTRSGSFSGIDKHACSGSVHIGELGLAGDEQGNARVHGGPDKAVHHYAFEHYATWQEDLGPLPLLQSPGAFGENISTRGLDEDHVYIGDQFTLGGALLEVSQGRQPCWKLNDRFDVPDMALRVQSSGRTGWYYRVLQAGVVTPGDLLELHARPYPDWSLHRLNAMLFERMLDPAALEPALQLPLVPSWRKLVERRLQQCMVEDWSRRVDGPPAA
jgi:MOSC domain-containing protein YiiM